MSRLQQLQCHFTWDLKKDDVDLENLSTRLQAHIQLQLGQHGAVTRSYSYLAYVRYLQDQQEEALSLLNQSEETILEWYGDESERRLIVTYGDMAWLKYHTRDYTQSQSYCQRVEDLLLKYTTGSSTSLLPEVYGEKAWTYLKFSWSSLSKAIDCFRKALEVQTHDSEWNAGYAIALFRTEQRGLESVKEGKESLAMKQLRFALEISPDDAVLQSMLAVKLGGYKKYEEAEDLLNKALKTDPDNPHVSRYIGKYFRNQYRLDESIDMLERALKRADQSPFIHHQLALCYKRKKIAEQSRKPFSNQREVRYWRRLCIRYLEEAVKIRPSFVLALSDLALLYAEERDLRRAEEIFQQCLKLAESEKSLFQTVHQRYADFHYYNKKNEAEAIVHYTKGLLLHPKKYEWRQCAKRLKQIAERRLSKNQEDGEAHALLGQVAKAEGDKKKAAEFYEKALDCDVDNAEYLSVLCELRMELQ
ncbi:interferon-induced protein with tetratricopeptide repeats 5-like isoform X2 [Archocentrus centrarchus]|uniref:interferon-induced protein with tetratricopeptide repeats 5-like isoform X2 n=1 Tax=Archocentrus centrarchus TaxID=63155 RepID=UPI0011EA393F|nr:interferon-induced protein with tetratricopeptide repeats 5-like isoform X2 [Archocentrus centrarchus]